jgi:pimeloyl-ACP methyl ester carboxylesterase
MRRRTVRASLIKASCIGSGLLLLSGLAAPVVAEIITVAELTQGRMVTPAQCAADPQGVWVTAMGRQFCMRYYLSSSGGKGARPVVFLNGDEGCQIDHQAHICRYDGNTRDFNTDVRERYAATMSKSFQTTMIYLARPGVDGSSGSEIIRHTQLELHVVNAALDAIKRRHGFDGFHIYGHSGGALLAGGLLALRNDIGCAVPADGPIAGGTGKWKTSDPAGMPVDPAESIAAIARNALARIMVLTDPQDRIVPIHSVLPFVEELRKGGGKVEQFFVDSGGDEHAQHHYTTGHAELVMRDCLRGASYEEVATDLADLVATHLKKALAAAQAKAAKQASDTPKDVRTP